MRLFFAVVVGMSLAACGTRPEHSSSLAYSSAPPAIKTGVAREVSSSEPDWVGRYYYVISNGKRAMLLPFDPVAKCTPSFDGETSPTNFNLSSTQERVEWMLNHNDGKDLVYDCDSAAHCSAHFTFNVPELLATEAGLTYKSKLTDGTGNYFSDLTYINVDSYPFNSYADHDFATCGETDHGTANIFSPSDPLVGLNGITFHSPLVLNFTDHLISFLGHVVPFDFLGDGMPSLRDWIGPEFGLLALPDADGRIVSDRRYRVDYAGRRAS